MSHLDYCNAILYGVPEITLRKLQRVQNMSAKLVLRRFNLSSNTQNLMELHWLPIRERIEFKIVSIVHKCLYGVAPIYPKELLILNQPSERSMRSNNDTLLLQVPRTKLKTFKARSFSVAGPTLWNKLPLELRQQQNFQLFKKQLKTLLFNNRFMSRNAQCYYKCHTVQHK